MVLPEVSRDTAGCGAGRVARHRRLWCWRCRTCRATLVLLLLRVLRCSCYCNCYCYYRYYYSDSYYSTDGVGRRTTEIRCGFPAVLPEVSRDTAGCGAGRAARSNVPNARQRLQNKCNINLVSHCRQPAPVQQQRARGQNPAGNDAGPLTSVATPGPRLRSGGAETAAIAHSPAAPMSASCKVDDDAHRQHQATCNLFCHIVCPCVCHLCSHLR